MLDSSSRRLVRAPRLLSVLGVAGAVAAAHAQAPAAMPGARDPGVRLIAFTTIAPTARDLSGRTETLGSGVPADRLGSLGSGIDYTGRGDRFILIDDRGPRDGADAFPCRWQEADIAVTDRPTPSVTFTLRGTQLLYSGERPLLGLAANLISPDAGPARFDPEGVRVLPDGSVLISEEYGPGVGRFERATGKLLQRFALPAALASDRPDADAKVEAKATKGRVPNNGLEGLALSPKGDKAYALMQGGLIQDGGKDSSNLRLIEIELATGAIRQFVYPVITPGHRTNEILAIDDHSFLIIERDGGGGPDAQRKAIVVADLRGATDITGRDRLPPGGGSATLAAEGIVPMKTRELFDLLTLDPRIDRTTFPAKIEGLAFGPDLPTGERCLIITSDNDFKDDEPTYIWAVAIRPEALTVTPEAAR